jgi:hypothetical protein
MRLYAPLSVTFLAQDAKYVLLNYRLNNTTHKKYEKPSLQPLHTFHKWAADVILAAVYIDNSHRDLSI